MKLIWTLFSIATLSLMLAACGLPPKPANHSMSWTARKQQLSQVKAWNIKGGLGLATTQQSFSASYAWQQSSQNAYTINLFGPLGMGAVKLIGMPSKVTLILNDGKRLTGHDAEALLKSQLGWQLPVNRLYYWLRGLPAPNSHARKTFDRYHHLKTLQQKDWNVTYLQYMSVNGVDLPHKIRLRTPFSHAVILINSWQIIPTSDN